MKKQIVYFLISFASLPLWSQTNKIVFEVAYKGKKIGTVTASEELSEKKAIRNLKTNTDTKVILVSVHVESEVKVVKDGRVLVEGTAYRHANRGAEDVHSHVKRLSAKEYEKERNGQKAKISGREITFCLIDLYFSEPVGLATVFSNMYAAELELKNLGTGKYQVVTPDKKNSYYLYKDGKLISIEVDTPVGKVTSTRI